jgi:hypothetical protein
MKKQLWFVCVGLPALAIMHCTSFAEPAQAPASEQGINSVRAQSRSAIFCVMIVIDDVTTRRATEFLQFAGCADVRASHC